MEVYVYDRRNFYYVTRAVATAWDLPLESYQAASGNIVVASSLSADYKGHWLIAGGEVWVIDRVEPADGMTSITILPGIDAFNRPIMSSFDAATNGELIYQTLLNNFKSPDDVNYSMPYLDISVTDKTPLVRPEVSEAGLWSLPGYLRSIADSTTVHLSVTGSSLRIDVAPARLLTHTVPMGGLTEILQQTYSRQFTAKVTVVQSTGVKEYYVDSDGMIGETPPSPRLDGEWSVVETRDNKDPEEAAAEIFAGNMAANKIAFMAPLRYYLGDTIRTRLNGKFAAVQVTAVRKKSSDSRYYYECGALVTSLSERLAAASNIGSLGGVSNKGGRVDGNLGIAGAVKIGGGISVSSGATIGGGISVSSGATIGGGISVSGGVTIGGGMAVVGDASLDGALVLSKESYGKKFPTTGLVDGRFFVLLEE